MRNNRDKTNKDWVVSWIKTSLILITIVAYFGFVFVVEPAWGVILFPLTVVAWVGGFVVVVIWIVQTISVIMMVVCPSKRALGIDFSKEKITLSLEKGKFVEHTWVDISTIAIGETFYGIYVDDVKKGSQDYTLPKIDYKVLEKSIDDALSGNNFGLKKSKDWIESGETGLNPNKDATGVNRTYMSRIGRSRTRIEVTIESVHGAETIWYRKGE